jgi:ADP-heptose:LPS heptosyltransferase
VSFPDRKPFRKPVNWLAAIATEALAPGFRAHARAKTGPPSPPGEWKRALIVGASHIGDLLYRSASLERLKAGLPQCDFFYLAAPGSCEILEGNPALTGILPWLRSDSSLDIDTGHFEQLRAMRFDAVLCINSGNYWPDLMLALRLGIPNRVGYIWKGFSGWVTHPIPIQFPKPYAAYFQDYVASLTGQAPDWPLRPIIYPNAEDEAAAARLWETLRLQSYRHVIACFMTTRQPTGVWPAANFGSALRLLRERTGAHIVLCGSAMDETLLARINRDLALDADLVTGKLGLRALRSFLRRCSVALTTDSGPRHIANAAGIPVYFFRNLRSDPVETGVYLESETDFCPAAGWLEPGRHAGVLAAISPELVADKVAALLGKGA